MEATITIEEVTQLISTTNAMYANKVSIDSKTIDVVFGPKTKKAIEQLIKTNEKPLMLDLNGFMAPDTGRGTKFIVSTFCIHCECSFDVTCNMHKVMEGSF